MLRIFVNGKKPAVWLMTFSLVVATLLLPIPTTRAADHGDAPEASVDRSADINDAYLFLDPNDNSRVILLLTVHGFIVPAEAVNFGLFDPNLRYSFELETNGDAETDQRIAVTFDAKNRAANQAQRATIRSSFFRGFDALTTVPNLTPTGPTAVVTTDQRTGISFFAGLVDDPFFFDIPAFGRFVGSVLAGAPNVSHFNRGRDSFAGYNTLAIGLSIPLAFLRAETRVGGSLGLVTRTARRVKNNHHNGRRSWEYANVDRMGNPAVNVALIPFPRKDEYNQSSTEGDANGRFAPDIIGTLTALGTNSTNIGILANVAVLNGDILRLNLGVQNSGNGGGNNAGVGFPNGRRLSDDVIDTILFFVANQNPLSDNANVNDVPFRNQFPFFGMAQQPRDSGVDDNTRN